MTLRILISLILFFATPYPVTAFSVAPIREKIDLAGEWHYYLPEASDSIEASGTLSLPGTLDTNGIGYPVPPSHDTSQLSRRFTYTGKAVYSRNITIPEEWDGKVISLLLERTRPSSLSIDGVEAGFRNTLSSPHVYNVSEYLSPGSHTIEITVDNSTAIPAAIRNNSHACSESTQTNWNGIIGDIVLEAKSPTHIALLNVTPDIDSNSFIISGIINNPDSVAGITIEACLNSETQKYLCTPDSTGVFSLSIHAPQSSPLWSEWYPTLHDITVSLLQAGESESRCLDRETIRSGIRKFSTSGTQFNINGNTTFLRGKHDACVWPLTGHTPMDMESWRHYFHTLKEYGINHVRFHSWCPPEACFAAADEAGIYLQPELPIWGELDKDRPYLTAFLDEDLEGILRSYAHHPSFVMFAVGNELWGDTSIMKDFIDKARDRVPGLLATYGSNIYLGWNGHIEGEDYLTACRVGGGEGTTAHTRASFSFADADNGGIMNSSYPNTSATFSKAIAKSPVPVIAHETGQYQFYPDFSAVPKYSGALRADNISTFREKAVENGTIRKSQRFFRDAGAWATKLYKADMEMCLRTPGMGGFQLLDIQDYPGQGTALVGILDPFLDNKGFTSPEEWRQSCAPVTILAKLPKRCFVAGESVEIPLLLASYSPTTPADFKLRWELPWQNGEINVKTSNGLNHTGTINTVIPKVKAAQKVKLSLDAEDLATNAYDIWIFPDEDRSTKRKGVEFTTSPSEALSLLEKGKNVILCPDTSYTSASTVGPLFQTDYWNYRMFRTICEKIHKEPSPGTLGLSIDATHPVFNNFPTDSHTDWQWFPIVANSRPLIIDRLPETVDPIVEPIDNVDRNYRLALMLECKVGKGKLLIIMADSEKMAEYPEGRQFLKSATDYMASKKCNPRLSLTPRQVDDLLTKPTPARIIRELTNTSYE